MCYTGGPRILWFLVPKSNDEMRGSWILRTVFSVKPQNGSKKIWKSTFWAFFQKYQFLTLRPPRLHFIKFSKVVSDGVKLTCDRTCINPSAISMTPASTISLWTICTCSSSMISTTHITIKACVFQHTWTNTYWEKTLLCMMVLFFKNFLEVKNLFC